MDDRRRLASQFALVYSVVFAVVLVAFSGLVGAVVRQALTGQIESTLADAARLIAVDLERADRPQLVADESAEAIGARVTIIARSGAVIADSASDPREMENHGDRPEVQAALRGEVGAASRRSTTLSQDRIYVAVPPNADGEVVRLSLTREGLDARVTDVVRRVWLAALPVGLAGLLGVWLVGRRLAQPIEQLTGQATEVAGGHLEVRAHRSATRELDQLGLAIADVARQLGTRIAEADEQRATLSAALGALPQGVIVIESDDSVSVTNDAAEELLGPAPARLSEITPVRLRRLVKAVRSGSDPATDETVLGRTTTIVSALATAIGERSDRVVLVVSDVTEERRLTAMRRDFVADASHELKTPIAASLAAIETLQMALTGDPSRAGRLAQQAESSTRRLAAIVQDLLDLSRLEASRYESAIVHLDQTVAGVVSDLSSESEEAGVEITLDVESIEAVGNQTELALAVRNLVDNAVRYTDPGGRVQVAVRRRGDSAEIVVADTGIGMPMRSLDRIFERFYRVDVARSRSRGGTGLGLALAKHVVERHGGTIAVDSELGVGSTFTITLPG